MANSNRKKRKVRKMMAWRKQKKDGNSACVRCHKDITKTVHHFLCNACWNKKNRKN